MRKQSGVEEIEILSLMALEGMKRLVTIVQLEIHGVAFSLLQKSFACHSAVGTIKGQFGLFFSLLVRFICECPFDDGFFLDQDFLVSTSISLLLLLFFFRISLSNLSHGLCILIGFFKREESLLLLSGSW